MAAMEQVAAAARVGSRNAAVLTPLRPRRAAAPVQAAVRRGAPAVVAAVTATKPAPGRSLVDEVERRVERAEASPLEGVPFGYKDFEAALSKFDFKFKSGDKVKGTIFKVDNKGAYADVGAKAAAFCPIHECSIVTIDKVEEAVSVGETREFEITRDDDPEGVLTLSIRKLEYETAWQRVKQLNAEDVMVKGEVLSVNRGGILVMVEGLRGFVPTSHLNGPPREDMIGQELTLKFLEVDDQRTRIVLSARKAQAESQLKQFQVGDVVLGRVQAVKPYGAFVDIGGINGLLHISQISHDRIANVENVLSEGDKLKVMILSHDKEKGRISLTTKKLEPTPGDMLRDPALVYAKADEMAATFKQRVAAAAKAADADAMRLAADDSVVTEEVLDVDDIPAAET
eukprot:jgi/Chlat1/7857/Chrsp66S07290